MSNSQLTEMLPGTAIGATALSTTSLRLYFQDSEGGVREFVHNSSGWFGGSTFNVKFQAKSLSPITVMEWIESSKRRIRIYSLNRGGYLFESSFDEGPSAGWYGNVLAIGNKPIQPASFSRLSAIPWDAPLKVFYQTTENKIQEIGHNNDGWWLGSTMPTAPGKKPLEGTDIAAIGWQQTSIRVYFQGEDYYLWEAAHENGWTYYPTGVSPKVGSPIAAVHWYDAMRRIRIYFVNEANLLEEWAQDNYGGWMKGALTDKKVQIAPYSKISAVYWDSKIRVYIQSQDQTIQEWAIDFGGYWYPASSLNPTPTGSKLIDTAGSTYSVGYLPWILDLKSWRTYDPSTIDGVGILVGYVNGRLVGEDLKTRRSVILQPNAASNSYTWVYTPEGAIFYRLWDHNHRDEYVRHSQLASGKPVTCAGEFRITQIGYIDSMLVMINDASGHYQPKGSQCLGPVAAKLGSLGIDMTQTNWYYNS
ncbi:hypothetical protein CPB83DRAFT_222362 [Crepidotus variabilis]|uniref:Fucose-specific lectin n=1 Tax=Crepidotus variabilis TaxID=179855 RepID=A0A9P6ET62_9AGAR|nr:hypothetical protein CPB83DRAFT_222362 [Crepidotus variabilis]